MPTEADMHTPGYFDTPERAERLQLISHLLNNAEDVPYLRAPGGAGKTRFAHRLMADLEEDYLVVWLDAANLPDIREPLSARLALHPEQVNWPAEPVAAAGEKALLLVVDNADALSLVAIRELFELHDAGARLLLLGNGGLARVQGDRDLQFVDLPPFTEEQSIAFLAAMGRMDDGSISEQMAIGLHRAAGGLPGHLVDAMSAIPTVGAQAAAPAKPAAAQKKPSANLKWPQWLLGGVLVLLVLGLLLFQDRVNSFFAPPADNAGEAQVTDIGETNPITQDRLPQPIDRTPEPPVSQQAPEPDLAEAQTPTAQPQAVPLSGDAVPSTPPASSEPPPAADEPDDVLDAVIEAAIAAAEQPLQETVPEQSAGALDLVAGEAQQQAGDRAGGEIPPAVQEKTTGDTLPAGPQAAKLPDAPPDSASPVEKSAVRAHAKPDPVRPDVAGSDDLAWLKSQSPKTYTLQLVGARDRAAIRAFVRKHAIARPYAVFVRDLNGKPWYSLVAGVYPDRDAAVAARAKLKPPLNASGVWPRTFGSIQEQL